MSPVAYVILLIRAAADGPLQHSGSSSTTVPFLSPPGVSQFLPRFLLSSVKYQSLSSYGLTIYVRGIHLQY